MTFGDDRTWIAIHLDILEKLLPETSPCISKWGSWVRCTLLSTLTDDQQLSRSERLFYSYSVIELTYCSGYRVPERDRDPLRSLTNRLLAFVEQLSEFTNPKSLVSDLLGPTLIDIRRLLLKTKRLIGEATTAKGEEATKKTEELIIN